MKSVSETACLRGIQKTRVVDLGLSPDTAAVSVRRQNVLANWAIEYLYLPVLVIRQVGWELRPPRMRMHACSRGLKSCRIRMVFTDADLSPVAADLSTGTCGDCHRSRRSCVFSRQGQRHRTRAQISQSTVTSRSDDYTIPKPSGRHLHGYLRRVPAFETGIANG